MNDLMPRLVSVVFLLMWFPLTVHAQDFEEGKQYWRLATPVPTSTADTGKIEVAELFWYGCPHCYSLEPRVVNWLENKPDNVEFVRVPAVLGSSWELGARAFFTAKALGVLDKINEKLFEAIHKERREITNKEQLAEFFAEQGVDKEAFNKAYDSFAVETDLRRSQQLVRLYRIEGVPTIIVNGKYTVTASSAGSPDRMFDVVNYLIGKESKTN